MDDGPKCEIAKTGVCVVHIEPFGTWQWCHKFDMCSICKEDVNQFSVLRSDELLDADATIHIGVCSHIFHKSCITKWLQISDTCPLCNQMWELDFEG